MRVITVQRPGKRGWKWGNTNRLDLEKKVISRSVDRHAHACAISVAGQTSGGGNCLGRGTKVWYLLEIYTSR